MSIEVRCICGKRFKVPDEFAGKKGKCATCGEVVDIPDISSEDLERIIAAGSGVHPGITDDQLKESLGQPGGIRAPKRGGRDFIAPRRGGTKRGDRSRGSYKRGGVGARRGAARRGKYGSRYDNDEDDRYSRFQREPSNPNWLFGLLSFFIPCAGLIIGIVYITKHSRADKTTGKMCLGISIGVILLSILISVATIGAAVSTMPDTYETIPSPDRYDISSCEACNGSGNVDCAICRGIGFIQDPFNYRETTCPTCAGTGKVNCPACGSR